MRRSIRVIVCALALAALAVACSDGSSPPDARIANEFDAPGTGAADSAPAVDAAPAADASLPDAPPV